MICVMDDLAVYPKLLAQIRLGEFSGWDAERIARKVRLPAEVVAAELLGVELVESSFGFLPVGRCGDCGSKVALPCYGCMVRTGKIFDPPVPAVARFDAIREFIVQIYAEHAGDILVAWGNATNATRDKFGQCARPKHMQWIDPRWIVEGKEPGSCERQSLLVGDLDIEDEAIRPGKLRGSGKRKKKPAVKLVQRGLFGTEED